MRSTYPSFSRDSADAKARAGETFVQYVSDESCDVFLISTPGFSRITLPSRLAVGTTARPGC